MFGQQVYKCATHVPGADGGRRGRWSKLAGGWELPRRCWELNLDARQEHPHSWALNRWIISPVLIVFKDTYIVNTGGKVSIVRDHFIPEKG